MSTFCIIPARGGSKSIPKKNIIDFCGKPLIAWSIEQALASNFIEGVYVSTDDPEIGTISKKIGAEVIWRPPELASDFSSSEEALLHAVTEIEKSRRFDAVVFLQATSPIRDKDDIDKAMEMFISENADSLFSSALLENFNAWEMINGDWKSLTYDYKNRRRRQDRKPVFLENGSIYIFKPKILKLNNNRLGGKIVSYQMPLWKSYEIDTMEDLELCAFYFKKHLLPNLQQKEGLKKIIGGAIDLIVYDFDGVMTDDKVLVLQDGTEGVIVNRGDGWGVNIIRGLGIPQLIMSTETNPVIKMRAKKLGIDVVDSCHLKKACLVDYCLKRGFDVKNVLYVGNDVNDLEVMGVVGIPIAPADAHPEVQARSKMVLKKGGGEGVIRELADLLSGYNEKK